MIIEGYLDIENMKEFVKLSKRDEKFPDFPDYKIRFLDTYSKMEEIAKTSFMHLATETIGNKKMVDPETYQVFFPMLPFGSFFGGNNEKR